MSSTRAPQTHPVLSVLDLVPVRTDQSSSDALDAARSLAVAADEAGYRRYWVAEHHNMAAVAATNPPLVVALLAAATRRIRVGSGGVMLPNHAPLVVAEQFALLEAAFPGRIDLGIGRAPGTDPVTSFALRHGAGGVDDDAVNRFPEYVDNVVAMMAPGGVGVSVGGRSHVLRATPAARSVPDPVAARVLRLLRTARRRPAACPTSSPTTSPVRAPPRRSRCTVTASPPRRARRARTARRAPS